MGINLNDTKAAVPVKKENKAPTVADFINGYKEKFAMVLPKEMTPDRFTRIAINAIVNNPELAKCSQTSLVGALLKSAECGLEPNTALGYAFLIPYGGKVEFQISYQGIIELARRANDGMIIHAHCVHENDEFEYELGLNPKLKHVPALKNRGEIIWVYAVCRLKDGGYSFEVMSVEDINEHRKRYSKAKNSPWDTAWEEMAKKTVVKKALKYIPKSVEFASAVVADERPINLDITAEVLEPQVEEYVEVEYEITEADGVAEE